MTSKTPTKNFQVLELSSCHLQVNGNDAGCRFDEIVGSGIRNKAAVCETIPSKKDLGAFLNQCADLTRSSLIISSRLSCKCF